eukprot:gene2624-2868_t
MSSRVKVVPSPRMGRHHNKYELAELSIDDDRFNEEMLNRPRRSSFSAYRDSPTVARTRKKHLNQQSSPSPRHGSFGLGAASASPRSRSGSRDFNSLSNNNARDSPSSASLHKTLLKSPSGGGSREDAVDVAMAFAQFADASPSSSTLRSSLVLPSPSRRSSLKSAKKKVTFRNPLADVLLPDNTCSHSAVEGDHSLIEGGSSDHSGSFPKEGTSGGQFGIQIAEMRKKKRRQKGKSIAGCACCTIS